MHKFFSGLLLSTFLIVTPVWSNDDPMHKADLAVGTLLFDYDGVEEFASWVVAENGFVDITFASNIPDGLYREILGKLKAHPDIRGVLAGKGGQVCPRFLR